MVQQMYRKQKQNDQVMNSQWATTFKQPGQRVVVYEDFATLNIKGETYSLDITISRGKISGGVMVLHENNYHNDMAAMQVDADDCARFLLVGAF